MPHARTHFFILMILVLSAAFVLIANTAPQSQSVSTPVLATRLATNIAVRPSATRLPATATATARPLTLPSTRTHTPTATRDPRTPSATPCRADWCKVMGVQSEAEWSTTVPNSVNALGYGMQIHGCGAVSKSKAVDLIAEAGFDWVKQQVRWDEVEGVKGAPTWRCVDAVVQRTLREGLKVMLSINAAPAWARMTNGAPDPDAFAKFAGQVAQRYLGRVAAIEVFNEPNLAIEWGSQIDPDGYAQLLAAAYQRIKSVDPSIIVISAGLAPTRWNDWGAAVDDLKYLRAIANTLTTSADCVGVHFNDGRSSPMAAGSAFQQITNDYRAITGKPLCLTEFGIASPLPGQTPPRGFEWSANTSDLDMARWLTEGFLWAQRHPGVYHLIVVWNLNYYNDLNDPNALYALDTPNGLRRAYLALKGLKK